MQRGTFVDSFQDCCMILHSLKEGFDFGDEILEYLRKNCKSRDYACAVLGYMKGVIKHHEYSISKSQYDTLDRIIDGLFYDIINGRYN